MDEQIVTCYKRATSSLNGTLIGPYQKEGVLWLLNRELVQSPIKGGFLCDEMGLGKTIQLIATILGNPKKRTLIIVPKSIVTQWSEEIIKFAPHLSVLVYDGPERTHNIEKIKNNQVVVAPYSIITSGVILEHIRWDRIILDEAHEIRNSKTKKCKAILNFKGEIKWVVSGTPVFNSIRDFVTLGSFIGLDKSVIQGMTGRVRERYVLRRTKQDQPSLNLIPCDFQNIELHMYPEEQELYEKVFGECARTIDGIVTTTNMHNMLILECYLRCRQMMIHPQLYFDGTTSVDETPEIWNKPVRKMDRLFELLDEHPDEKALIFCQFINEMNFIEQSLINKDYKVFRIDGSVSKDDRNDQIHSFKEANTKHQCVFIIQIKAGGQGLNLQEATRVYITSPSWNPATELQAIGRSHRAGQTKKVYVKKLTYVGTNNIPSIEESMMELQGSKSRVCAEVLNDERLISQIPISSRITIKDIKKLFHTK
jgi:SNF2 family DNA or RNA helicase